MERLALRKDKDNEEDNDDPNASTVICSLYHKVLI
jgi:hypothetical protein